MAKKLTQEQRQNIVDLYLSGKSGIWISENFHHSVTTIAKVLREEGIKVQKGRDNRWYTLNEHYLDELDTAEKYYFLGFFYADGYWSPNSNMTSIDSVDKEILEEFLKLFETNRPLQRIEKHNIENAKISWSFRLENPIVHQKLFEYGCDNTKSYTATFPYRLFGGEKRKFIPDFIRGVVDGDGGWHLEFNSGGSCSLDFNVVGTHDLCLSIKEILDKELEIDLCFRPHTKSKTAWYISTSKKDYIPKIVKYLYGTPSELFLKRKYDITQDYLYSRKGYEEGNEEIIQINKQRYKEQEELRQARRAKKNWASPSF